MGKYRLGNKHERKEKQHQKIGAAKRKEVLNRKQTEKIQLKTNISWHDDVMCTLFSE